MLALQPGSATSPTQTARPAPAPPAAPSESAARDRCAPSSLGDARTAGAPGGPMAPVAATPVAPHTSARPPPPGGASARRAALGRGHPPRARRARRASQRDAACCGARGIARRCSWEGCALRAATGALPGPLPLAAAGCSLPAWRGRGGAAQLAARGQDGAAHRYMAKHSYVARLLALPRGALERAAACVVWLVAAETFRPPEFGQEACASLPRAPAQRVGSPR